MAKIYVGNLPFSASEADIRTLFSQHGTVESVSLPTDRETAILVGGGVGIPPMLYLAEKLAGKKAVAMAGATTRDLLPLKITSEADDATQPRMIIEEFSRDGFPSVVSTDDGSFGSRGCGTQAFE